MADHVGGISCSVEWMAWRGRQMVRGISGGSSLAPNSSTSSLASLISSLASWSKLSWTHLGGQASVCDLAETQQCKNWGSMQKTYWQYRSQRSWWRKPFTQAAWWAVTLPYIEQPCWQRKHTDTLRSPSMWKGHVQEGVKYIMDTRPLSITTSSHLLMDDWWADSYQWTRPLR